MILIIVLTLLAKTQGSTRHTLVDSNETCLITGRGIDPLFLIPLKTRRSVFGMPSIFPVNSTMNTGVLLNTKILQAKTTLSTTSACVCDAKKIVWGCVQRYLFWSYPIYSEYADDYGLEACTTICSMRRYRDFVWSEGRFNWTDVEKPLECSFWFHNVTARIISATIATLAVDEGGRFQGYQGCSESMTYCRIAPTQYLFPSRNRSNECPFIAADSEPCHYKFAKKDFLEIQCANAGYMTIRLNHQWSQPNCDNWTNPIFKTDQDLIISISDLELSGPSNNEVRTFLYGSEKVVYMRYGDVWPAHLQKALSILMDNVDSRITSVERRLGILINSINDVLGVRHNVFGPTINWLSPTIAMAHTFGPGWIEVSPVKLVRDYCLLYQEKLTRYWPIKYTYKGRGRSGYVDIIQRIIVDRAQSTRLTKPVLFSVNERESCDLATNCTLFVPNYQLSQRNKYLTILADSGLGTHYTELMYQIAAETSNMIHPEILQPYVPSIGPIEDPIGTMYQGLTDRIKEVIWSLIPWWVIVLIIVAVLVVACLVCDCVYRYFESTTCLLRWLCGSNRRQGSSKTTNYTEMTSFTRNRFDSF